MKLLVFGATGRTGHLLVDQALSAGHDVVAYTRDPAKLTITHDQLRVARGELSDVDAIDTAIRGVDAVIASLSPQLFGESPELPLATGTRTVLTAMSNHGVQRFVFSWGPSITLPHFRWNRRFGAMYRLFAMLPATRPFITESAEIGEAIRDSELDWTIATVVRPVDRPATGHLDVRAAGPGTKVTFAGTSRTDLARFLLDEATHPRHRRQTVLVSN